MVLEVEVELRSIQVKEGNMNIHMSGGGTFFLSNAAKPSLAKTLRLGLRPTTSRLAVLLTRKASKKRMRGCVICMISGGLEGSWI